MFDNALSPQQLAVICALSTGATMTAAAQEAGVHRNTVHNWQRNLLPFQQALGDAQYDRALYFREKIEELVPLALKALDEILAEPKTPSSVRLRAALAIAQLAAKPPEPKKQIQLDIQKVIVHPTPEANQPAPAPENPPTAHNPAQPPSETPANSDPTSTPFPHNSAQFPRRVPNKVGRNEACPCGSGLKFKRCCIDKPQTKAA